jgi:hypothetical protein
MTLLSSQPQVTPAVLDDEEDAPLFQTCRRCHTPTRPAVWWTEHVSEVRLAAANNQRLSVTLFVDDPQPQKPSLGCAPRFWLRTRLCQQHASATQHLWRRRVLSSITSLEHRYPDRRCSAVVGA